MVQNITSTSNPPNDIPADRQEIYDRDHPVPPDVPGTSLLGDTLTDDVLATIMGLVRRSFEAQTNIPTKTTVYAVGSGQHKFQPTTVRYKIRQRGAGSGGAGGGGWNNSGAVTAPAAGLGAIGGDTSFSQASIALSLIAKGAGTQPAQVLGAPGGVATGGNYNRTGGTGGSMRDYYYGNMPGGHGAGEGQGFGCPVRDGQNATAGTGAGGAGGAGPSSARDPGGGGGQGGYLEYEGQADPTLLYDWVVGRGGVGGTAGYGGYKGGDAADGWMIIEEYAL